jgi:acid stress-induced BolA-like protein IbaG/YrbA
VTSTHATGSACHGELISKLEPTSRIRRDHRWLYNLLCDSISHETLHAESMESLSASSSTSASDSASDSSSFCFSANLRLVQSSCSVVLFSRLVQSSCSVTLEQESSGHENGKICILPCRGIQRHSIQTCKQSRSIITPIHSFLPFRQFSNFIHPIHNPRQRSSNF